MEGSTSLDSEEVKFKGLDITSLDDVDNEDEEEEFDDDDDEDADDLEEEESKYAILGFLENPKDSCTLLRHFFPSKAGGSPAWLDPVNLPSGNSFLCDICGDPLQFVMQVYAPPSAPSVDDDNMEHAVYAAPDDDIMEHAVYAAPDDNNMDHAYHRTLFVFICTSMVCLRRDQHEQWKRSPQNPLRSVKVFRCQLFRDNPFYSSEHHQIKDEPCAAGAELCAWCGTWKAIKECSNCKKVLYCSEKHKVKHSQQGHDYVCQRTRASDLCGTSSLNDKQTAQIEIKKAACTTIWPEFKIEEEDEEYFDEATSDSNGSTPKLDSRKTDGLTKLLVEAFECDEEKKSWASFMERISWAPEQVLRYYSRAPEQVEQVVRHCKDSKPLWPMPSGRPSKADIPLCKYCGGSLVFEFQILPQLLYYFQVKNDVDSLDWATIAIYTCEAYCQTSVAYSEEFAWVQLS